jgi:large subunit ribosomal protein L32
MEAPAMATCDHCGSAKRPHRVCPVCGYYNGVEVVNMKDAEA